MFDESHATPSPSDVTDGSEPTTSDRPRTCGNGTASDRGGSAPIRGDDEPPPGGGGVEDGEGDDGPEDADPEDDPGSDSADETLEYRLERLRLVRTVVTLAVVIARLIRSV